MNEYTNKLIEVLKGKQAKRFYWNTFNGVVGLLITYAVSLDLVYTPLIIAMLNGVTKEINTRFL